MQNADIGLCGAGVMGRNLAINMESKGFTVAIYDVQADKVKFFETDVLKEKKFITTYRMKDFINSLARPRKMMLMVPAGEIVDKLIDQALPLMDDGDIIIDGGNSHFPDTIRRTEYVQSKGKLYIGTGVSGGEQGALKGPAIMPGGSPQAWQHVKPIFQKIAAKTPQGEPCCDWVGENGAGHFVKTVHNGIEYGDMQLIAETYHMMKQGLGMTNQQMHQVFAQWYQGELNSYLIEITRDILAYKDQQGNEVIDLILDTAGQKGTGKWAVIAALDLGRPLTLIAEAVFARCLSALKEERLAASKVLNGPKAEFTDDKHTFVDDLRHALYASKIISYAQGYQLMRAAAAEYNWNLNYGGVALIWRGGCIIRSVFLGKIKEAFDRNPDLRNLLLDPFFKQAVDNAQPAWRRVVAAAIRMGIPVPAMTSALMFYDGYRHDRLPANLLQAQRDYFGAHTYERIDKPRGQFFHTNWIGRGGETSATTHIT